MLAEADCNNQTKKIQKNRHMKFQFAVLCCLALFVTGCAVKPYNYHENLDTGHTLRLRGNEPQIERGRYIPVMDETAHYLIGVPTKLLFFDWEVNNHHVSRHTEQILDQYLAKNGLHNVKVRLNQYAPGDEWRRLFKNSAMPGFFRYTVGIVTATVYTIFPGRFFAGLVGGDSYNPYTNTISLYSDNPTIALHEAAHAKDFALKNRHFRGWYALMRVLPLVPLWQEAKATGDAIGYTDAEGMTVTRKESYETLYPAYSTYITGEGLRWIPIDPWLSYSIQFAATLPAHLVGRIKAANVEKTSGSTASCGDR